ncbi:hypothetical protein M0804_015227 [Polistes exclamans]|nr:hypothetical protein M0804_015228 [Polistes exclamans]KAI4473693.1 hypothetical protein M0804_015227 [Polistes exclamans]
MNFQTGHMRTSSGSYFIKPTEHWRDNEKDSIMASSLQHAIYRVPPVTESTSSNDIDEDPPVGVRNCAVIGMISFIYKQLEQQQQQQKQQQQQQQQQQYQQQHHRNHHNRYHRSGVRVRS